MFDMLETRIYENPDERIRNRVAAFLTRQGLAFEGNPDVTVLLEDSQGNVAATASLAGDVIKMAAVDPAWREGGLSARVISRLLEEARARGRTHLFVYTKPDAAENFRSLGFEEIARYNPWVVLLEMGEPGIESFRRGLRALRKEDAKGLVGACVVNCNPFTLGHQYLVEQASIRCVHLYVVVVESDLSLFPFRDRIRLVREGTVHFPNVTVLPSGPYAVSPVTFPAYFLRNTDDLEITRVQTRLDVALFAALFCRELGIGARFVGTEPYCPVTDEFNKAMLEILPPQGIEVQVIPRRTADSGDVVSASSVRRLIREERWDAIRKLVPDPTWNYLRAPETRPIIDRIWATESRH